MNRAHVMSGGRYPVLRALGILYVIGAVAVLCYGLYMTGWALFRSPGTMGERFTLTLQALAGTFFGVITILALAELIKLVIDIEHNTRVAGLRAGAAATTTTVVAAGEGAAVVATGADGRTNRLAELDEESAEAALLRGH